MSTQSALQFAERNQFSQVRAFTGDILYTVGMPAPHMYVIKDGEVDLYLIHDEKRTVVETLEKGQCFGMASHLRKQLRTHNAVARTYCELFLITTEAVNEAVDATPELVRSLLHSTSERLSVAHKLISARVNYQNDLQIYAQLLYLLGIADLGKQVAHPRAGLAAPIARPKLHDVFVNARLMFGHSDKHIRGCLGKLLSLHVIRIEDERGEGKQVLYTPRDIVAQVRKAVSADPGSDKMSYEYISVDEFATLVEADRNTVLKKLAASEFADDVFTFRRAEVLRLLDEKGKRFFVDRRIKSPAEFSDIDDLEFADQKSIFAAIAKVDSFDLAKVMSTLGEGPARAKVMKALSTRRREELDNDLQDIGPVDPVEAQQIGKTLIAEVKAQMLQVA